MSPLRLPLRQNAVLTLALGIAFQALMIGYTLFTGNAGAVMGRITLGISTIAIVVFLGVIPRAVRTNRRWRAAMAARDESLARLHQLQAMLDEASAGPPSPANAPRPDRAGTAPPQPCQ